MQNSWILPANGMERYREISEGTRPSGARLTALIDLDDPAVSAIAAVLGEMREAGIELDEQAIAYATSIGRHRFATAVATSPQAGPRRARDYPADAIVYYVRRGSVVKIGTTRQPHKRFSALLPTEILAVEPGSLDVEATRHVQFQHLRIGGTEHFRITSDLLQWVEAVRQRHGDPDPTWPTMATLHRPGRHYLTPPPPPTSARLVTATEGADECGIKRATVHAWVHRGVLKRAGGDRRGRSLYFLDHVAHFAAQSLAASTYAAA